MLGVCGQLVLGLHLYTAHFTPSAGLNNNTPGGYASCRSVIVGAYFNSQRRTSLYVGYVFNNVGGSPFDAVIGAVTGYDRAPVMPLVLPSFAWRGVRLSVIPSIKALGVEGGLHLSYELVFK